jgi:hypothetical protein
MAKNQSNSKSFLLYLSWEESFNLLSCEEQSQFIKNMFLFHKGEEPILNTPMLTIFWKSIEYNLHENGRRYNASVENGKLGGAPKGNKNALKQKYDELNQPKQPNSTEEQPKQRSVELNNLNVNVNGNINDNVNVNDNVNINVNVKGNVKNIVDKAFEVLIDYDSESKELNTAKGVIEDVGGFDAAAIIMEWDEDVKQNWYQRVSVNL